MPKATAQPAAAVAAEAPAPAAAEEPGPKPGKIDRPPAVDPTDFDSYGTVEEGEEYVNTLWWGKEGSGKTTDIAYAALGGRVLVINAEGGLKKRPLRDLGIPLENLIPWPQPNSGVEINYDTMDQLYWRAKARLMAEPGYFFAVAWDSASDIYSQFVSLVRKAEFEKNAALPVAKRKDFRADPFFTDRADYGVATDQLRDLLRRYKDLPCHFLVSALERRDVDEETSAVAYGPGVGPAFQKDLLGYMDVVVNARASMLKFGPDDETDTEEWFRGLTRNNGRNRAKDRLRAVPRVLANPTFERILGYVTEDLVEEDDPIQKAFVAAREVDREWQARAPIGKPGKKPAKDAGATAAGDSSEAQSS